MSRPTAREMVLALYGAGMTDNKIADEANVSQPTITRIRNGTHPEPQHKTWAAITDVYLKWQATKAVKAKAATNRRAPETRQ